MRLENIIGIILLIVLVFTAVFYSFSDKKGNSDGFKNLGVAPEISTPNGFINTDGKPITLEQYRGEKIILLDIWTYSCINCQRTLPYLNEWYEKYHDQGLEIIGLHTPEFSFEHKIENVEKAVKEFEIKYPVVLDNDYSTWRAYGNKYWPRKYLIDLEGNIIYDHIGEGSYEETEMAIQKALGISDDISNPKDLVVVDSSQSISAETYFGAWRNNNLANGNKRVVGEQNLTVPDNILPNNLYLGGLWKIEKEYAESVSNSKIVFKFKAKNVYMVSSAENEIVAEIYIDGKKYKDLPIKEEKLYGIFEESEYGTHTVEIKIPESGLQVFTFTFG
jgi:thiol-disulfide isomerase/thioredoxin